MNRTRLIAGAALHAAMSVCAQAAASSGAPADSLTIVTSMVADPQPREGGAPVAFMAAYEPFLASGSVTAHRISDGLAGADSPWGRPIGSPARLPSTATLMDSHDDQWPAQRLVLSARSMNGATIGIAWVWDRLSPAQQAALRAIDDPPDDAPPGTASTAPTRARERIAYLRGDRRREASASPPGPFRARASRHGAIVHSKLWFLAARPSSGYTQDDYAGFRARAATRPAMLYVGADDGMLHGFDASTGQERIAYVPEGLHARLAALTQPKQRHASLVDGSPLAGDLFLASSTGRPGGWRSYLAGFPGRGGRGYFVLDVTDPRDFDAARAADLVVLDRTNADGLDRDIGHILSDPVMEAGDPSTSRQITRMNDGRWALVTGNGRDSADQKAVLLIQYLDGAMELRKIEAGATPGRPNGLSAPRLIDLDGNGTPDLAYAGDLQGQLWKFDLSATSPSAWRLLFAGAPLFVAREPTGGRTQPITSAPVWKAHPDGGLMLAFGTGRAASAADRQDTQVQSVYGIHDDTPISRGNGRIVFGEGRGPLSEGRSQLVRRTVEADPRREVGMLPSRPLPEAKPRGWFLDLPISRERVLRNPGWFEGDLIDIWSTVPSDDPTEPPPSAARSWRTTLDILDGSAPRSPLYLHLPAMADAHRSRVETGTSLTLRDGAREIAVAPPGEPAPPPPPNRLGRIMLRPSWRQWQ